MIIIIEKNKTNFNLILLILNEILVIYVCTHVYSGNNNMCFELSGDESMAPFESLSSVSWPLNLQKSYKL